MSDARPDREWWTAQEIAEARLPDLPASKRGVQKHVDRMNWTAHAEFARRRKGRGGGWEFLWKLFPSRAQQKLLAEATPREDTPEMGRDDAWSWFDTLPEATKDKARARLQAVQEVEALEAGGMARDLACAQVARRVRASTRTMWNWLALIEGVRSDDRLPYLAPRHTAARRKLRMAECDDEFMDFLKADFLRLEGPAFSACYRRAVRVARDQGWEALTEKTAKRRLDRDVSALTQVYCRKGVEAVKRLYPAQVRDRMALHAMEAVNADYHRFDVFVRWPDGQIVRPQMVAFQDVYSGRILSWRVDQTPNKVGVQLALGDMVERFGIPDHVLLDNGREFANKFLTGGVPTRFRFKVRDDDIPGILPTLGCVVHWATPYSGQSKPIERAFRDMCEDIAKDPRFEGAYTGNNIDAKPENYGNAAVPLERFLTILAEGIEEHNARGGRRGQTTIGRSILETFEASYAVAPVRKATDEQRRLWLMGAEGLRADSRNGVVRFQGSEFWSDWMHQIAGEKIVARFDPADFRTGLHLYALDGRYLGHAEMKVAGAFFDLEEARNHAAARRKFVKAEAAAADAARKLRVSELGGYLDAAAATPDERDAPAAKVVRPVFAKPKVAKPRQPDLQSDQRRAALVASFAERKEVVDPKEDTARERYARAKEIKARIAAGEPVTRQDERWLISYRDTPEFRSQERLEKTLGTGNAG